MYMLDNKNLQRLASKSRYKKNVIVKVLGKENRTFISTNIAYQGASVRYFNLDGVTRVAVGRTNSHVLSTIFGIKLKSSWVDNEKQTLNFAISNLESFNVDVSFVYSSDVCDEIVLDTNELSLDLSLIKNRVDRMVLIGLKFQISLPDHEAPFVWTQLIEEIIGYENIQGIFEFNRGYVFSNIIDEDNIKILDEVANFVQYVSFLNVEQLPYNMNYISYAGVNFLVKKGTSVLSPKVMEQAILRFSYSQTPLNYIRKKLFKDHKDIIRQYRKMKFINLIKLAYHTFLPEEIKLRASIIKQKNTRQAKSIRYYNKVLNTHNINENLIFVESSHGRQISKNLTMIADSMKAINPNLEIVVSINDIDKKLDNRNCKFVLFHSKEYYKVLATAKYFINDVTMIHEFKKRDEQIYVNTWHGTPIKKMGKAIEEDYLTYDNIQRNFLMADKIYLSNDESIKYISRDYFVDKLTDNFKLMPSVRNSIFYDTKKRDEIREKYNLTKKVVVWMPTWRGDGNRVTGLSTNFSLFKAMEHFELLLGDEYDFYVKVHPLVEKFIRVTGMKVVPNEDIYDFLTAADCLITDYSSIMFDFLNADKKICLYIPDLEEYKESRGLYFEPSDLNLPMANTPQELASAIKNTDVDVSYDDLKNRYCPVDCIDAAQIVAQDVLSLTPGNTIVTTSKRRVLLYPGQMQMNGITTAAMGLIEYLASRNDIELTIYFPYKFYIGDKKEVFKELYNLNVNVLVNPPTISDNILESVARMKVIKHWKLSDREFNALINFFNKDCERTQKGLEFDDVIHFEGYHSLIQAKMIAMDKAKMHLFVHNNLLEESRTKNNINMFMNSKSREYATTINVVNETVMEVLFRDGFFEGTDVSKVSHVRNIIDSTKVIKRSELVEPYLDDEDFTKKLFSKDTIKICSIGRLSHEKGFIRLIEAFDKVSEKNSDKKLELFLIAGYGPLESEIKSKIRNSKYVANIDLKVGINPHPILKEMDLMIMASFYEGLPMTLFEAMALGIPVMSTDIPGPGPFLKSGYGHICEDSMEGIFNGLDNFVNGKLPTINASIDSFNTQAKTDVNEMLGLENE